MVWTRKRKRGMEEMAVEVVGRKNIGKLNVRERESDVPHEIERER